ncbi:hypothetical protein GCU56_00965 [Geodermatophilus sabuli]|uniref:Uncharacterized protein n=1 Tax=Geodermatophilus sabuli TaxID=1564158 RepID=A0A7K3VUX2_9ACTN|nr:hypothetical protein [Geodermatophilus sabuli]NEK56445.1 hypothetical protein [Geodermatophilus sabuli]
MDRDPGRQTGDYNSDLVHEEVGARDHRPAGEHGGAPPAGSRDDPGGDLGYDEAHDR